MDIPSPYAGTVLRIFVAEGEVVPVGARCSSSSASRARTDPRASARLLRWRSRPCDDLNSVRAPQPLRARSGDARSRARSHRSSGVDLATVYGLLALSGRITEEDVRAAAARVAPHAATGRGSQGAAPRDPPSDRGAHVTGAPRGAAGDLGGGVRLRGGAARGSWLATVVKACAESLAEFPELNARFDGDAIVYLDRYDIGVAVQSEQGLVVPCRRGGGAEVDRRDHRPRLSGLPTARAPGRSEPRKSAARLSP